MTIIYGVRWSMKTVDFTNYLDFMAEREILFKSLKSYLLQMNDLFYDDLLDKYTKRTAEKHTSNIELFVMYLEDTISVVSLSDITKGIINSKFRSWCKSKVWGADTDHEIKVSLNKFFRFLLKQKDENEVQVTRIIDFIK